MKTESKPLADALARIKTSIGGARTLPILSCVKISAKNGTLKLEGSDLDQWHSEEIPCEGNLAETCVSLNYLASAIGGAKTEIEGGALGMTVTGDFGSTEIATLEAEEFPPAPKHKEASIHGVSCADLSAAIKSVFWSASTDIASYVLQSAHISSKAKKLIAVSTNGRELAVVEDAVIGSDFEMLVPDKFASNLCAALLRDGAVLSTDKNNIRVQHLGGSYSCKQLDGSFPNYRQVIPDKKVWLGEIESSRFKELLARCLCFAAQLEANGKFTFSKTGLKVDFAGDNKTKLSYHIGGKFSEFVIALNIRSLFKIMQNIKGESVGVYHAGDDFSPITIESGNLVVLTMPMRMK